jgi:hypothetical protein
MGDFPEIRLFSADNDARTEIRIEEVMESCDSVSWGVGRGHTILKNGK